MSNIFLNSARKIEYYEVAKQDPKEESSISNQSSAYIYIYKVQYLSNTNIKKQIYG